MRISVEARATAAPRGGARASVVIDTPRATPPVDQANSRSASVVATSVATVVATVVAMAGALTSLPELSARLPARVVIALHFVATVGTSAQPLVVTLVAAVVAAIADRRAGKARRVSSR